MSLRTISREYLNLTAEASGQEMHKCLQLLSNSPELKDDAEKKKVARELEAFEALFKRYLQTKTEKINWSQIKPPSSDLVLSYDALDGVKKDSIPKLASQLAILKLNGGLGTTMGCVGPKSVIEVRAGNNFLDMTIKQIRYLNKEYGTNVPLVLMNSFNTHDDTLSVIKKYGQNTAEIFCFNQSRYPRIWKDSLLPAPSSPVGQMDAWYPPGHGDLYVSLYNSGVLDNLIKMGKKYIFVSNVDNLGATVDFDILQHMEESGAEFLMEVTDKTRADVKGGTLIEYEGKPFLLEIAQVPSQHVQEFKSIKKFKIFNTNNMWLRIDAIKRVVEKGELNEIPVIPNVKSLDGKAVIQLETAAGAAISAFKKAHGINVPRSRFLPVKSTSDLLLVQSDIYKAQNGTLVMNPERPFPGPPVVKLGDHFKKVSDYHDRVNNVPDILELDQLTIAGDVTLGSNVVLKGTVIVVANHGSHIDIPGGSVLENKVVTGNLRILDH